MGLLPQKCLVVVREGRRVAGKAVARAECEAGAVVRAVPASANVSSVEPFGAIRRRRGPLAKHRPEVGAVEGAKIGDERAGELCRCALCVVSNIYDKSE